jgi:hypothetical protein
MIELSPITALMLYLCLTLTVLMALWLWNHMQGRRKVILPPKQDLVICEYCHTAYIEDVAKKITQCPGCQSYNKNQKS